MFELLKRDTKKKFVRFKLSEDFLSKYKDKKVNWGPLGEITYLRTYSRLIKKDNKKYKEVWWQTIQRVVEGTFTIQKKHCFNNRIPWNNSKAQTSAKKMYNLIFNFKFLPPGRGLWSMGSDYVYNRGGSSLNNCGLSTTKHFGIDPITPFLFLMDMSMLGVGVGFDVLGAKKNIKIKYTPLKSNDVFIVPDSREGWIEALKLLLEAFLFSGKLYKYDFSKIRPEGAEIKGFGGTASGPQPLIDMLNKIEELLRYYGDNNKIIDSVLITDIMNLIGKCVVSGNVRRSSEIAIGDINDSNFMEMKNWEKFPIQNDKDEGWRWSSNNSIVGKIGMDYKKVANYNLNGTDVGIIWLDNMRKYSRLIDPPDWKDKEVDGCNPCVTGNTKILTKEHGYIEIEECIGKGYVHIWNGDTWSSVEPKVTGENIDVYDVEFSNGDMISMTEYHELPMENGNIKLIDVIESNHDISEFRLQKFKLPVIKDGDCINSKQAWTQGFYSGDGSVRSNYRKSLQIWLYDKKILLKDEFDSRHYNEKNNVIYIDGDKYKDKDFVPFKWDLEAKLNWLSGLIDSDGCLNDKGESCSISSINKHFLKDIQMMLCTIGCDSIVGLLKDGSYTLLPDGKSDKKEYLTKDCYRITISANNIKKLINLGLKTKRVNLDSVLNCRFSKAQFIRIRDIRNKRNSKKVYCFNELKNHKGIFNTLLLCQCSEQSLEGSPRLVLPYNSDDMYSGGGELCCVSYNTRIQTKNGSPLIGDVVGKEVEVWNGDDWSKVIPFLAGEGKELYRIYLSDGSYLDCTNDHGWHIKSRNKKVFRKIETKDLTVGDTSTSFEIDVKCNGFYEPLAYQYGLFSGDGYIEKKRNLEYPMLCVCGEKRALKEMDDICGFWRKEQIKNGYKDPINRLNLKNVLDIEKCKYLNNKELGLPNWVFEMDKESILQFVAGLIDTNGSCKNQLNTDNYIIFGNESKIRDVQILLRRVEINYSTIHISGKKDEETNFGVRNYDLYNLYIPTFECSKIPTRIKIASRFGNKYKINNAYPNGKKIDLSKKQRVIKIEKLFDKHKTYCFNEPENNMGVFGNVLTYQCLVETFPSLHDSYEEYCKTLKYAYMYAKTVTLIPTHWEGTNSIMLRNRRIGTSQSGIIEAFLKHGRSNILDWCDKGYKYIRHMDDIYSDWLCVPRSIKITSVKPSGTVSLLPGVTPGIHYPWSEYYIRRIRIGRTSKLANILRDAGYEMDYIDTDRTFAIKFPVKVNNFDKSEKDVSMWQQAANVADYQRYWADNQVSCTIKYNKSEKSELASLFESMERQLKAISVLEYFNPEDNNSDNMKELMRFAPYETITKEKYEEMVSKISEPDYNSFITNCLEESVAEKFCDSETCEIA